MHGLIHAILKDLVLKKLGGAETWSKILGKLGLATDDAIVDDCKQYDDSTTVAGIKATAEVVGVSYNLLYRRIRKGLTNKETPKNNLYCVSFTNSEFLLEEI